MKIAMFVILISIANLCCRIDRHIERYKVNVDSLKTLPNAFYQWRGGVFIVDLNGRYGRVWFDVENHKRIKHVNLKNSILSVNNQNPDCKFSITDIDTNSLKNTMQRFVLLSNKFRFGNLLVDKKNHISFSSPSSS